MAAAAQALADGRRVIRRFGPEADLAQPVLDLADLTPIFTPSMLGEAGDRVESSSVTVKAASSFLGIVQTPTSPPA
ncbi:MAG: hypothetical protein ACLT1T_06870 [Oscillospiraceae bacterium]